MAVYRSELWCSDYGLSGGKGARVPYLCPSTLSIFGFVALCPLFDVSLLNVCSKFIFKLTEWRDVLVLLVKVPCLILS